MPLKHFTVALPERIPFLWSICGAGMLFVFQLLSGTSFLYAELIFLFVMLSAVAVNLAGGLKRLGGFCIALMSLKIVIISQVAKQFFGEAGDYRLNHPESTAGVLLVGIASITCGCFLARPFRTERNLFQSPVEPQFFRVAGVVTLCLGMISHLGVLVIGSSDGALMVGGLPGLLRQLAFSLSLSVVFSSAAVILESDGRKLISTFNALPLGLYFLLGVLGASKQGMFEPFLLLALTAVAFGFRFSPWHVGSAALLGIFAMVVLFPFAQVARNYTRGYGLAETISLTADFAGTHLTSAEGLTQLHQEASDAEERADLTHYYDHSLMLLERVSLIKMVDLLVGATIESGTSKWETITHGFEMLLPRFLYPRKPAINTGTFLGKKAGVISDDDWGTQISFGFIADSFSAFGWLGAAIIPGIVTFFFLLLFHWLSGPLYKNPWTVCFYAEFQHFFAEQTISGMTQTVFRRPIWLLAIYLLISVAWIVWKARRQPRVHVIPALRLESSR